ncbi:uncharacterized protein LOC123516897 isoform X2 [Portunus trituberculatus]|uniref:uncharacterized protein LOC123516897 isoform X2 n=1 Tax=Portunus trituberculatus TaxID=210409 RepID=UPI001E1CE9CF|nr:uncharacterized protein LOC123516897 isoform X2 [Portunus trituberculatus]
MVDSPAVLLVFLALGLEGVPSLALAQHCHASPDVLVSTGSVDPVYYEVISGAKNMSATLFLQPLSGFEGISVEASVDTDTLSAWFATDQCCPRTLQSFTWVPLKMVVEVKWHTVSIPPGYYIHYMLDFGGCVKECKKHWSISMDIVGNLKVVAHGSSRWKCDSPPHACLTSCNNITSSTTTCQEPSIQFPVDSPSYSSPCKGTPMPAATPTPATTSTPTGSSSTVVTNIPAATPTSRVGSSSARTTDGCVLRLRRPASLPSPPRHHRNSSVRISMNSLYEAYSGPESLQ